MDRKIIYFGDIVVLDKKDRRTIKNAVFLEDDKMYKGFVIHEIISKKNVGLTSSLKNYTEVKKNEEKRNNITGAYE